MRSDVNRLLVIDGDASIVESLARIAGSLSYSFAAAHGAAESLRLVDSFHPTLIVIDLHDAGGKEPPLLSMLAARECRADVVLLGAADDATLAAAATDHGRGSGLIVRQAIRKPASPATLATLLAEAVRVPAGVEPAELERALAAGELVPHFQPQARLADVGAWRIDGVEALARWPHPERGMLMPDAFVPLAERTGSIGELTVQIAAAALAQLQIWNDAGVRLRCALNLPPGLATDLGFPARLTALLEQHGIDATQLTLEVTETAAVRDPTAALTVLTELQGLGVGLALDDFGTGYSSLTRLYQMPFGEMKIDRSLVLNMPRSREANTMVASLIELGHNLGLEVCAEGVESAAALDYLAALGCDRCQGFFLSRALPAAHVLPFIDQWNDAGAATPRLGFSA